MNELRSRLFGMGQEEGTARRLSSSSSETGKEASEVLDLGPTSKTAFVRDVRVFLEEDKSNGDGNGNVTAGTKEEQHDPIAAYIHANPLNAAREGEIIAQAGRPGIVTVATNMAGRGTDILLGRCANTM